jgi:transposase-like protein
MKIPEISTGDCGESLLLNTRPAIEKKRPTQPVRLNTKVALEAITAERSVNEIASRYGVHPHLVGIWKRRAVERISTIF